MMNHDLRVRYFGINLSCRSYILLQLSIILVLLLASALFFVLTRANDHFLLRNGWWICLILAFSELIETFIGLRKAKTDVAAS